MDQSKVQTLPIVLLLGPPGIGKTSLCKALSQRLNMYHLSIGDFCRALDRGEKFAGVDEYPQEVHECLKANESVPGKVLVPLFNMHLHAISVQGLHNAIILDGFPRSSDQQKHFEQIMPPPTLVLSLHCPVDVVRERYLGRKDPNRPGEDAELFQERLDKHLKQSSVVEEIYDKKASLIKIDVSEGMDYYIDAVATHIEQAILPAF